MDFMEDIKIYVLDTSVFVQECSGLFSDKAIVTTYMVSEEVKSADALIQMDILIRSGMKFLEFSEKSMDEIKALSEKLSDNLSLIDMSVAALALDFMKKGKDVCVVSEDNSLKNLCKLKGIEVVSVKGGKINNTIRWVRKCVSCGKKTSSEECPVCGSETKYFSRKCV